MSTTKTYENNIDVQMASTGPPLRKETFLALPSPPVLHAKRRAVRWCGRGGFGSKTFVPKGTVRPGDHPGFYFGGSIIPKDGDGCWTSKAGTFLAIFIQLYPTTLVEKRQENHDVPWLNLKGVLHIDPFLSMDSVFPRTSAHPQRRICCWSQPTDDKTPACTSISSTCSLAVAGRDMSWKGRDSGIHRGLHLWCFSGCHPPTAILYHSKYSKTKLNLQTSGLI